MREGEILYIRTHGEGDHTAWLVRETDDGYERMVQIGDSRPAAPTEVDWEWIETAVGNEDNSLGWRRQGVWDNWEEDSQ